MQIIDFNSYEQNSKMYGVLPEEKWGFEVHNSILRMRNGKVVVACKDF